MDWSYWACWQHRTQLEYLAIGIGFLVSVFVGHFAVYQLVSVMRENLRKKVADPVTDDDIYPHPELSSTVGILERFLYTASWYIGEPGFIVVWLGLKVAGSWQGWSQGQKIQGQIVVSGQSLFNVFLLGSGLSLAYAIVGALLIKWIMTCQGWSALFAVLSLIGVTWILWCEAQEERWVRGWPSRMITWAKKKGAALRQ